MSRKILALSGGVGGAKLAAGLDAVLPAGELTIVCNTADDFEHLGLHVSPDLDSVLYALAGLNDTDRGWGRADEGWRFMEAIGQLGGEDWFNLGDRDLATHVQRTLRLRDGATLSQVTDELRTALGIRSQLLPMSDDPVRTIIETKDSGDLAFQHYFVRDRCAPPVRGFRFDGAAAASCSTGFRRALDDEALEAIVVCPSNPFVSVDPILAVPGVREALRSAVAPVIAVSPIVGGQALKGPAAKMMEELGLPTSALSVAEYYGARQGGGLLDGFVLDRVDADDRSEVEAVVPQVLVADTVMSDAAVRRSLAQDCLEFASTLR
ncbi:MAG: 2-phospho-L-lactate transferase [Acidobacteriota bacterium]